MLQAIIIISVVLLLILVTYLIKRGAKDTYFNEFEDDKKNLGLKKNYLNKEEAYFFTFVSAYLSKDYYILPKVGVDNLVEPLNYNLRQYNAIKSKYIDFIIFDAKTNKPLFAIDLIEQKASSDNPYFDNNVEKALKMVGLPIMVQNVADFYVWSVVEQEMEKYLPKKDIPEQEKEEQKD